MVTPNMFSRLYCFGNLSIIIELQDEFIFITMVRGKTPAV